MNFKHKFSKDIVKPLAALPSGNSKVQQHMVNDTDINKIIAKYRKTGVLTHVRKTRELYGDFTEMKDVAEALDVSIRAKQVFESLPAELRNKFQNSIPGFFSYIQDPKNLEDCIKMGIYDRKVPAPSQEPVPEVPPKAE